MKGYSFDIQSLYRQKPVLLDVLRQNAVTSILTALATYFFLLLLYRAYFHPLAKYPGPTSWALTRIPWVWHMQRGQLHRQLQKLHDQYGTTVRIAPDEISTIAASVWNEVYVAPRPALAKDPYSQTRPFNGAHSLFTAEGDTNKRIRSNVIYSFTDKHLREVAPTIDSHAARSLDLLRDRAAAAPSRTVDIWTFFGDVTINMISDIVVGERWSDDADTPSSTDLSDFMTHGRFSIRMNSLNRWPPLRLLFVFLYFQFGAKLRIQTWKNGVRKIMDRLELGNASTKHPDMVSPLVTKIKADQADQATAGDSGAKGGISNNEFQSNVLSWIFVNALLTPTTMANIMYFLAQNQETLTALSAELRSKFTSIDEITVQSTQDLPYLNAVFSETLRLAHPTPISLPRVVPKEGLMVNGHHIPRSIIVGTPIHVIQTSPKFWTDATRFCPERFLSHDDPRFDKRFTNDRRETFQPYLTGPRACIGGKLFLNEARPIIAKIVWAFHLRLADPQADKDWLDHKAWTNIQPTPLRVVLTPAEH